MSRKSKPHIMVLGGGFGGLETAFYLRTRLTVDEAAITLVSDRSYFLFKPSLIYVPFGLNPERLKIALDDPTEDKDIRLIRGTVRDVDPRTKTVLTNDGSYRYDYAVIAIGAGSFANEVPGQSAFGQSIYTTTAMLDLRKALNQLTQKAQKGQHQKVLFVLPPNNLCVSPLYEISFMLDTWLRRNHIRNVVELEWTTFERSYIEAFGPRVNKMIQAEFDRRGIAHHTHFTVQRIEKEGAVYENGHSLPYDLLISFPAHGAARLFRSLPIDDRGFIGVDMASREVIGCAGLYVAGDASNFPLKQAFLAVNQADAVADHIAADVLDTKPKVAFAPMDVYIMDQLDKASFAQVPLTITGEPESPTEVRTDAPELYRVGSSPLWRLGKEAVSAYFPFRFQEGDPIGAGLPWIGMEAGLALMSKLLAH